MKCLTKQVNFCDLIVFSSAAFKIVKSWLGPEAVSLLKFTSKNEIQEYVSVEYLPPHMGGTVSTVLDTYRIPLTNSPLQYVLIRKRLYF